MPICDTYSYLVQMEILQQHGLCLESGQLVVHIRLT